MIAELKRQVRLYAILARAAALAAVFRRGPSKQVLLVLWRTDTDQFYEGQWFKGRIYERRCDLSPSGNRLIYFAADYKKPYFAWTAVSKPPFLTALALWPKGDAWGGGGLFAEEHKILLNHRAAEMQLGEGFSLPQNFLVKPFGQNPGWGEDNPILDERLTRDGWRMIQAGEAIRHGIGASVWIDFNPAIVWSKRHLRSRRYELQMQIRGLNERTGPWYLIDHVVKDSDTGSVISLERTDWADWCSSGDLLFAKDGKLFRLALSAEGMLAAPETAKLLIDLTGSIFKPVQPSDEAKQWDDVLGVKDLLKGIDEVGPNNT
jgi:hypothetical protein